MIRVGLLLNVSIVQVRIALDWYMGGYMMSNMGGRNISCCGVRGILMCMVRVASRLVVCVAVSCSRVVLRISGRLVNNIMRCVVDQWGLESVSVNDFVNNWIRSDNRGNNLMDNCLVKARTCVCGCMMCGSLCVSMSIGSFLGRFCFFLLFLLFRGLLVVDFMMKWRYTNKSIIIVHFEYKVAILNVHLA